MLRAPTIAGQARKRLRTDSGGCRRDHFRALAQRVEVDAKGRIMGAKSELLRALVAASNAKTEGFGEEVRTPELWIRRLVSCQRFGPSWSATSAPGHSRRFRPVRRASAYPLIAAREQTFREGRLAPEAGDFASPALPGGSCSGRAALIDGLSHFFFRQSAMAASGPAVWTGRALVSG
jgi:hypothetical protein